jgi:thymidylate kinase
VALIGGDGAGKTTIAEHLTTCGDFRAKYMYMGISAQSGDRLLPTSRLVLWLKRRAYRKRTRERTGRDPTTAHIPAEHNEYATRHHRGLWVAARLVNRFAEAWYRQVVSQAYQARGYLVVYDRHVLFDTGVLDPRPRRRARLSERIFDTLMRAFPRPDAVLFLETPGHLLYARKGEATAEYLDREARMYLAQADAVDRFVRLDASQPLEDVKRQATEIVAALHAVDGPQRWRRPSAWRCGP